MPGSTSPRETPMIVEFARQLNLPDYKAFHDAWRSIHVEAANKAINGLQENKAMGKWPQVTMSA